MKVYQQDPNIYRRHFGGNLPGFKGARIQHGNGIGSFLGILARKAIPIIRAGVKLAAPHVKQAGKDIAKDLSKELVKKVSACSFLISISFFRANELCLNTSQSSSFCST